MFSYSILFNVFLTNSKVAACKTVEWETVEKCTEKLEEEQGQSATQSTGTPVLFDVRLYTICSIL